ncbi:hypothetical protein Btru_017635 [Bulinus truncatus]|nr:hypothetical protein Btru_017635 [Bulinus truncatus]
MTSVNGCMMCVPLLCGIATLLGTGDSAASSGTKFLFSLPRFLQPDPRMSLAVHSPVATQFYFSTRPRGSVRRNHSLRANTTYCLEQVISEKDDPAVGIRVSYVITSDAPVDIMAYLTTANTSATIKLLPVAAWGSVYYAVTMSPPYKRFPEDEVNSFKEKKPYGVGEISSDENENAVSVMFRVGAPWKVRITYKGRNFSDGDELRLVLNREQSFTLEDCKLNFKEEVGSLTGTKIQGRKPIGVLTGNCWSVLTSCGEPIADLPLDSPLPIENFGTEFVVFSLMPGTEPYKEIWIVATRNRTVVWIANPNAKITLGTTDVWRSLNISGSTYLNSTDPIQVAVALYGRCPFKTNRNGAPSISSIIPKNLFFHIYTWRSPSAHSVVIVVNTAYANFWHWSNQTGRKSTLTPKFNLVSTNLSWQVVYLDTFQQRVDHMLKRSDGKTFGCYVVLIGNFPSYLSHMGFRGRRMSLWKRGASGRVPTVVLRLGKAGQDFLTYFSPNRSSGGLLVVYWWSIGGLLVVYWWSFNEYFPSCSNKNRVCRKVDDKPDDRCKGTDPEVQFRPHSCYEHGCPTDCDPGRWGEDCHQSCQNCVDDCDKFTGECFRCKPGYKGFKSACQTECGDYEYGINCEGDCRIICASDCVDRISGSCSQAYDYEKNIIIGTIFVILLFGLLFFCLYVTGQRTVAPVISSQLSKSYPTSQTTSEDVTDESQSNMHSYGH